MKNKLIFKDKALLVLISALFIIFLPRLKALSYSEGYPDYNGEFYFRAAEKAFNEGRYSEARSYYLTVELNYGNKPFARLAKKKAEISWNRIKESRELNIIEEKKREGVIEITYEIVNKSKRKLLISYYIKKGIPVNNLSDNKVEYSEYDVYLKPGQRIKETYLIPRRFFWDEEYKIDIKETMFLEDDDETDANAKQIKWGSIYQGELKLLEALREKEFNKSLAKWEEENKKKQFKFDIIKSVLIIGVIGGLLFLLFNRIWKRQDEQESIRSTEVVSEKDLFGGEMEFLHREKKLQEEEFEKALKRGEPAAILKFFTGIRVKF